MHVQRSCDDNDECTIDTCDCNLGCLHERNEQCEPIITTKTTTTTTTTTEADADAQPAAAIGDEGAAIAEADPALCGNGVLDDGEECDGSVEPSESVQCDENCRLKTDPLLVLIITLLIGYCLLVLVWALVFVVGRALRRRRRIVRL